MARILNSLVGHHKNLEALLKAREQGKLPSQLIFYGPEGVGKKLLSLGLIQAILCEKSPSGCGECGSCLRVEQKISENVFFLSPEKNLIKIDQIRSVLDFLSLQSWGERPRIILIEEAHTLNSQASNALLKVFEEPPQNTHFILITHRPRKLLSTLRSRAKMVGFTPLRESELREMQPNIEAWKMRSAKGSMQMLNQLQNPEVSEVRQMAARYLEEFMTSKLDFFVSAWRDDFKDRELVSQIFDWWLIFIRDSIVLLSDSTEGVISQDQLKLLQRLSGFGASQLHELFQKIHSAGLALWGYQDPVLLVESLFIDSQL